MSLRSARILVADDQPDVARTLTEPLRAAGASLRFVSDGIEALDFLREGGYDLLIADMKMPPEDWGGLWLLRQLQQRDIKLPCLVLSGEGQQRETVEAMRLGAVDWIAKGEADAELLTHCTMHLDDAYGRAVEAMATGGASPLAYGFARYQRAVGGDRQYAEGLRLLEEVLRFVALIGLATCDPLKCGPFRKLQGARLARPSFGTWLAVVNELAHNVSASPLFAVLTRQLMPDDDKPWQEIARLRNNQHHGGSDPEAADRKTAFGMVDRCAHRLQSTPFTLGSHAQMRYVNNQLEVSIRQYRGAFPPRSTELTLVEPEFLHSPDPYLFYDEDAPIRVDPWFSVFETDAPQGSSSLAVFDGVKTRKPNRTDTDDVLVYTDPMTGERGKRRTDRRTTWGEVSAWFASGA